MTVADILRSQISERQIAVSIREAAALTQLSESTMKRMMIECYECTHKL